MLIVVGKPQFTLPPTFNTRYLIGYKSRNMLFVITHLSFLQPMTAIATIKMMMIVTSSRMMPPPIMETTATMVVMDVVLPVETTVVGWDVVSVAVGVPVSAARLAQQFVRVQVSS